MSFLNKTFRQQQVDELTNDIVPPPNCFATPSEHVEFETKVSGVHIGGRQSFLKRAAKLDDTIDISLVREPDNTHDRNAIQVIWNSYNEREDEKRNYSLGYIPALLAESIAPIMDKGVNVNAHVLDIPDMYFDDDEDSYGMILNVYYEK